MMDARAANKPLPSGWKELQPEDGQRAQRTRSERRARDALVWNEHEKNQAHSKSSHTNDDPNARELGNQEQQLTREMQ